MQSSTSRVISGVVQKGRRLGRALGFPTANIAVPAELGAPFGIYATRTRLPDGRRLAGVASLGVNPTFGAGAPVLEVCLFDFSGDLYGSWLETELVAYLRAERRFEDVRALTTQMRLDAARARRLLFESAEL